MVLFSYVRAISGEFCASKKLSGPLFRCGYVVAVTAFVVYLMISPYMASFMKRGLLNWFVLTLLTLISLSNEVVAQCAMCRAQTRK